jgi:N-methylhydantoinase A
LTLRTRREGAIVGVDVGGTFTDIVIGGPQGLTVQKLPTTLSPDAAIVAGLAKLGTRVREARLISHATTLATNALLTHSGLARSVLITNEGFRDVLEIGRQRRPEVYDLDTRRPPPLIERRHRLTISCRIRGDGTESASLGAAAARSLARRVIREGYQSVAISFLNSYLDATHELRMKDALRNEGFGGHINLSSEVDPEYREFERTSTTVVNAVLCPLMAGYLSSLAASLRRKGIRAPVYLMNSEGGASTLAFASSRPVAVIESGPAAGVVASQQIARKLSLERVLTFDMGGTTAKAGTVIDGEPEITGEFEAAGRTHSGRSIRGSGYPVRGQFIDLAEVSAGGGTVAWVDDAGELEAGPRSAGSVPGPACYGKGGTEPTVTDANVALGRLNPHHLLGGAMKIRRDLALRSLKKLGRKLGQSEFDVASGVIRLVNDSMARAISMVTVERGRDPRDFAMVAFGGAGPVHACELAEEMGVDDIVVPVHAGLFSAYGLLAAEMTRTFVSPVMEVEPPLKKRFEELDLQASREMRSEGFETFGLSRYFDARYLGQSHELLLPFSSDVRKRGSFDERHRALYGYSLPDKMEVVNIKVKATVHRGTVETQEGPSRPVQAARSHRSAWIGGRLRQVEVLSRESLRLGQGGRGPVIIEEYDSTLVINESWKWTVEQYGTRLTR